VVRSEHRLERLVERQRQITRRIEREFGPVDELRAALGVKRVLNGDERAELRREISFAISQLSPGDIIDASGPDLPSPLVTVSVSFRRGDRVKAKLVDREGDAFEVNPGDLDETPVVVGRLELPEPYLPNSVSFLYEVGQELARSRLRGSKRRRKLGPSGAIRSAADVPPKAHKALRRLERVDKDLDRVRSAAARRAESLAAQFDRVIELLEERGHLDLDRASWALTPSGQRLARLYHECDLLVVEAMEEGVFDRLNSAEVAAMASSFVYEERGGGPRTEPWYPSAKLRRRFLRLQGLHLNLVTAEHDARLPTTRAPDAGFMAVAHGWAAGGDLADVLADEEITAGDFVRTAKQLIDLLRQLALLAPVPATATAARAAAEAVFRDLVAASSIVETGSDGPNG
jgi:ATP-dependent RNA helicase HelY